MLTFACTHVMKRMLRQGWGGVGWGGVGHVNIRLNLRHEAHATSRMGWGRVGHVNVCLYLGHEVDATSRMGWGGS